MGMDLKIITIVSIYSKMNKITLALKENAWTLLKLTWFLIFMYVVFTFLMVQLGFIFDSIVSTSCPQTNNNLPVPTPTK
jgi:hypothetical protein